MPISKILVEFYRDYSLFLVGGTETPIYIAEKEDPSKGITVVHEDLEVVKQVVDNVLAEAKAKKINVSSGNPERSEIIQKRLAIITSNHGMKISSYGAVIVCSNYNIDELSCSFDTKPVRRSKKHGKTMSTITRTKKAMRNKTHNGNTGK